MGSKRYLDLPPSIWNLLLWTLPFLLSHNVAAHDQQAFRIGPHPHPQVDGVLRRFTPDSLDGLESVLDIAQSHDLDIWQIGSDAVPHVDIYSNSPLPSSLLSTPHSIRNISTHAPSRELKRDSEDWDLTSLENTTFHAEFHRQPDVDAFIFEMARLHPESVSVLRLGHSAEEREMLGMKISTSTLTLTPGAKEKLGFVVLGPQHAREWVATSTALYLAHALLSNSSEANSLSSLLDVYDFHIIPSPNPDGYVHTWDVDRFWYKNRQIVGPNAKCIGIDMNRNWGSHWKPHAKGPLLWTSASSDELKKNKKNKKKNKTPADPCSHWYPGHRAFEAPEVNNLANYITKVNGIGRGAGKGGGGGGVVAMVDLRSYGQMLATPYSYKCDHLPKDNEDQMEALLGAAQAARSVHGTSFTTGRLCELLYRAPGNILDYVYQTAGIKYAYAAFLRDTGTYGFAIPPEWIRPVGEETGVLVDYLARFVARQRGIPM
ncbi:zinc carboxypeptidase [Favolaschia claudopus]|uniref:Zinc carboxypeptidase n=1 Tax=Favolaschia claudopus TaxID=2862362 RepID=A0AAW0DKE9_9AGAR